MKNLTKREMDILRILWKSEESLLASEIAGMDTQGSIHSIQTVLKSLLKKEMIEVDDIVYSKNVLARRFKPVVSAEHVEKEILETLFQASSNKTISAQNLFAAFIPHHNDEETLDELSKLEEMIIKEKQRILDKKII